MGGASLGHNGRSVSFDSSARGAAQRIPLRRWLSRRRLSIVFALAIGAATAAGCGSVGSSPHDAGGSGGATGTGGAHDGGQGGSPGTGGGNGGAVGTGGTVVPPDGGSDGATDAPATDGGSAPAKWDVDIWDTARWS
jgi:hypothetical protein